MMYNESYSPFLIIFSILIAIFSSYTTLVLVGRILDGKRAKKKTWLFTGAFVMGSGIFSMHFIGMIAFHSNHSITVNGFLLVLAFISSLLSSYAAFYLLQAQPLTRTKILISGLSVGLGIVLLHYIATFAVHEKVAIQYKSIFFTLSILISLVFSFVAIKMFVTMRSKPQKSNFNILINSVVLGVTVSAMHYTGMKATNFLDSNSNASSSMMIDTMVLGNIISYSIIFIMMATLITAYHDHRILITERRLIKQLKESELRYRHLVEQSPEPILVHNGQTILFVNEACLRITHATSKNELIGKQIIDFIDPINREVLKKHIESIEMEGRLEISQQKIIAVDGSIVDVEITWIGIMYDNQPAIQLVLRDITEQNKLKRELEEKQQRYSSLFEYNPDPVLSVDCQGNFKELNSIVWDLLGYSKEDLLNMSFHSLIDPSYLDLATSIFYKVLGGKPQNYEVVVIGKKGDKFPANLTLIPIIIDKKVTGVFCIAKNLTKEKEALQRIEELAYTDQLTGLFNRTSFNNYLKEVLTKTKEDKTSIAILMMDFDNFKDVNDILGHNIGDLYLQRVSERLRECLHQQDKIAIARIGGDEFIILLEDVTKGEAGNIARTILSVMNHAIHIKGHDITVTLSIGISINSDSNIDVNTMIKQADLAMYHAKEQGKNNYQFFTNELKERALRKVKLESALRGAIEKEELKLHYQPLVEIQTGKLVGVEALLRWNPIFGSVSPSEFIPIAENTGLIVEIGEWVIEEACRQLNSWQLHHSTVVPVSLNVSARQFKEAKFTKTVKQIIQDAQINPSLLEIEITESVMMDIEESVQIIQELRDFGVKIAIDDFGTGYSSLYVITNLKYDTLKLDKSLIDEGLKPEFRAILLAVLESTRDHKRIVVEGIETKEQFDALKSFPIIGQGYYFGKPLPPEEMKL
jgi:diguanylate cyclase